MSVNTKPKGQAVTKHTPIIVPICPKHKTLHVVYKDLSHLCAKCFMERASSR